MRRLWIVLAALGLASVVLSAIVFVVPLGRRPSTRLNAGVDWIDIEAGRYRYQRYILGVKLIDRVEETPLSRMYRQLIGPPPAPEWRRGNLFHPFSRRAEYTTFSSAHGLKGGLVWYLQSGDWSEGAQREAIQTFLYLLHNRSAWQAKLFLWDLNFVSYALAKSGKVILDASDLPQLYDIRMEVRTGEEPTFTFVAVADLPQMTGKPLGGVKIVLEVWEKTGGWTYRTDTDGSMRTAVIVPRWDPWEVEKRKELAMGFSCAKEGYVTVEGEFSIEDFRGKMQAHGRALLVRMPPTDR